MIDQGPRARGRDHTPWNGDPAGQQQREQRQFQRGGHAAGGLGQDGLPGGDRTTEIAAQQVTDSDQDLLGQRQVQPPRLPDPG